MSYTWLDVGGLCLAILVYLPLFVLPGIALSSMAGILQDDRLPSRRLFLALVSAFAVLPFLDSTLIRFAGINAALAANLSLACCGNQ